jgi:hypothetical protein
MVQGILFMLNKAKALSINCYSIVNLELLFDKKKHSIFGNKYSNRFLLTKIIILLWLNIIIS